MPAVGVDISLLEGILLLLVIVFFVWLVVRKEPLSEPYNANKSATNVISVY